MHTATPTDALAEFDSALHGACEQSARSVLSALWPQNPGVASDEAFTEILLSMTGAIERTAHSAMYSRVFCVRLGTGSFMPGVSTTS